jgi:hypothetical protein
MAIDFEAVKRAVGSAAHSLIPEWIPDGHMEGQSWKCLCPFHPEKTPSCVVHVNDGGWFRCFGCQAKGDVITLYAKLHHLSPREAGERLAGQFNIRNGAADVIDPSLPDLQGSAGHWIYRTQLGTIIGLVARYNEANGKKRFSQWTWRNNQWVNKGFDDPKPLFNQTEIYRRKDDPILVCEGEKACIAAQRIFPDYVCTTWPGGAQSVAKADWSKLSERDVIFWPDNDAPGQDAASALHQALPTVRIVKPPNNWPVGWDLADPVPDTTELRSLLPYSEPFCAKPLSDFVRHSENDEAELIKNRFLCRSGAILIPAPTGIGKSTLSMQLAMLWGHGKAAFGLVPNGPLRSLIIQAENDDGDIAEQRDGVCAGLGDIDNPFTPPDNVFIHRCDDQVSDQFFKLVVEPLVKLHKPDLLWIDPVLAYLGGEATSQKDVGHFLRNLLNPLIRKHNCGAIVVHHTNKPPQGKEKSDWKAGDFAYLGAGSAEWANWPRGTLAIRSLGDSHIFELVAAKRGRRLGWKDEDGNFTVKKYIKHHPGEGVLCWLDASREEVDALENDEPKSGRKSKYKVQDVVELVSAKSISLELWQKMALECHGIPRRSFFRLKNEALALKLVWYSKIDDAYYVDKKTPVPKVPK